MVEVVVGVQVEALDVIIVVEGGSGHGSFFVEFDGYFEFVLF